jgi:hypothetical protein
MRRTDVTKQLKPLKTIRSQGQIVSDPAPAHMTGGEVIAMAPERVTHARAKYHIARRLTDAIDSAGVDCETFIDGLAVVVDSMTVYEPDVLVRCGTDLDGEVVRISDTVVVVEVLSRSTKGRDTGAKLADYFRLPSGPPLPHRPRRRPGHHPPRPSRRWLHHDPHPPRGSDLPRPARDYSYRSVLA